MRPTSVLDVEDLCITFTEAMRQGKTETEQEQRIESKRVNLAAEIYNKLLNKYGLKDGNSDDGRQKGIELYTALTGRSNTSGNEDYIIAGKTSHLVLCSIASEKMKPLDFAIFCMTFVRSGLSANAYTREEKRDRPPEVQTELDKFLPHDTAVGRNLSRARGVLRNAISSVKNFGSDDNRTPSQ